MENSSEGQSHNQTFQIPLEGKNETHNIANCFLCTAKVLSMRARCFNPQLYLHATIGYEFLHWKHCEKLRNTSAKKSKSVVVYVSRIL